MEILDGDVLYELIFRRYSKNPRGWSFTVSPSARYGFFDALVENKEESWQLKFDTIFKPSPMVIGASTHAKRTRRRSPSHFQFGFRELNRSMTAGLENGDRPSNNLAALLASMEPVVPRQGRSYAEGPYLLTQGNQGRLNGEQLNVDDRLSAEMRKLVQRRYPSYG